jgi:hypothetical protein
MRAENLDSLHAAAYKAPVPAEDGSMPDNEPAGPQVKRGRGRPPKLPPPGDRRTARLTLTADELERMRQAIEALRKAGQAGLSQAEFTRRAVMTEVDRVLGAARPKRRTRMRG